MAEDLHSSGLQAAQQSDTFELLCACCRADSLPEGQAFVADSRVDWKMFSDLAEHHGVLPLVAKNLTTHASQLPADVRQSLCAAYEGNLRRSLWFAGELKRIVQHLEHRQLRTIPYKGPMLAESAYGDIGLRSYSDLDLLISPEDFARAKQALDEIGYRPSQDLTPAVERLFLRTGYERAFDRKASGGEARDGEAGKNLVELQWALLPFNYGIEFESGGFSMGQLFERAKPVSFFGSRVLSLAPEDSLLILCLHAAKHLWTRMIWIADVARTLDSQTADMSTVLARAEALGIGRILAVSLWLANRLRGVAIPEEAETLIENDDEAPKIGERCIRRMAGAESYSLEAVAYFREIARLRERKGDRWRYSWRLFWTPGPGEVAAIKLPEALFPLYHGVRAVRLLRKLASK